ncbi:MAG: hypothetical protein JW874_09095 [Spirochaetales bacterium]|nr:hypothetical protein [Spirochaetales bacterium]
MKPVYLQSGTDPKLSSPGPAGSMVLSRNDYLFYSFPLPPLGPAELHEYLLLRIKNLYPGDLNNTGWFYYVQKQRVFAVVLNGARYRMLQDNGLMEKLLLPPSCRKKYPWPGKFDMLIEYPDCYELISIENHCLTQSHVFSTVTDSQRIGERLSRAIAQFSGSDRIVLCPGKPLADIDKVIKDNYRQVDSIDSDAFFTIRSGQFYRLWTKTTKQFPIPQSVRVAFYLLIALLFGYLALDEYQSGKEKTIFAQNNQLRSLESLKTDNVNKLAEITRLEKELGEIREREGSNVFSFMSALALEMEGATLYTITLAGRDYEITGIHDNPLILVDNINSGKLLGKMKLRSSVPDPDTGRQYFSISGEIE